jgi:hypothetical protein
MKREPGQVFTTQGRYTAYISTSWTFRYSLPVPSSEGQEDWLDKLYRNVGNQLPTYTAWRQWIAKI